MQLFIVLIVTLAVYASAGSTLAKSLKASVKDTSIDGLDGLNLKLEFPYELDDAIVGIRHTFGGDHKLPEELFARKTVDIADGKATVDATFNTKTNVFSAVVDWVNDKVGTITLKGDSNDNLKSVALSRDQDVDGKKISLSAAYDLLTKKIDGCVKAAFDDTCLKVEYDTDSENAKISVTQKIDDENSVTPTFSVKDSAITVGVTHKLSNGEITATVHPGDKVVVDWSDNAWKVSSEIPIDDRSKSKVSVSRDWSL